MSKRKEILGQSWMYSLGTQTAQLITLLAAVFSRRFLGPTQTGIWTTLQILVDYSKYSTLGTMDAVSREIPYRIGKGELEAAEKTKNLAATFVFTGSVLMSSLIASFAFVTRGRFSQEITYGLYFVAIVIFLQRINNLQVALLRCYKRFDIESVFMIASAIVNAVLVGTLAYFFEIYGFIWALILSLLFNIFFVRSWYKYNFKWTLDPKALKPLISFGLPLMALGLGMTFFRSLDRILIAKFLGFEPLGWYSIALMVTSYASNFPIAIGVVLLPHFQEKYGAKDDPADLRQYLHKSVLAMVLFMPILLAFITIAAPYAISAFLPEFLPGVPALKILILSMFFISLSQLYYDTLVTVKKHWLVFPSLFGAALLTAALDWLAIQKGFGIEGVAAATTAGFFIYFLSLQALAGVFLGFSKIWNRPLGMALFNFVYLSVFTVLTWGWSGTEFSSWTSECGRILLFVLFCAPLLLLLDRQLHLTAHLREKWARKKA